MTDYEPNEGGEAAEAIGFDEGYEAGRREMPPGLQAGIELLIKAASDLVENDDEYWTALATGQDSEESEHSGYLAGLNDGLEIANLLLFGGYGPEYLIRHNLPPARKIEAAQ